MKPVTVHTARHGAVLEITIDRPAKGNAIDASVTAGLAAALERLEDAPELRVGLLTGAGERHFCLGSDLGAVDDLDALLHPVGGYGGVARFPRTKPLVAALNGDAVGGGMELALACDFALAADHARIGFPEVTIGVIAGAGGALRLPGRVGVARTMELLLTGRLIDAAEAASIGLVARSVPADLLRDEALRVAQGIAAASPPALRATRELVELAARADDGLLWRVNDEALERVLAGPDAAEGRRAFLERRAPSFTAAQPD